MCVNILICYSIQSYLFLVYVFTLKTDLLKPVFHKSLSCVEIESLGHLSIILVVPPSVLDLDTLDPSEGNKGPEGSVCMEECCNNVELFFESQNQLKFSQVFASIIPTYPQKYQK